jgi:hypothetical protein
MMVLSFVWGQKAYRIPYAWKKLVAYIVIVVVLYLVHKILTGFWHNAAFYYALATLLLFAYLWFVGNVEQKEMVQLPFIGKYFEKKKAIA